MEQRKDIFKSLLESAPDAILVVDSSGVIRLVNRQTEALFMYSRGELIGRSIETLVPLRLAKKHHELRKGYVTNPHDRPMDAGFELVACRADGSEFPADISLSRLETEEGMLISAVVRDMTERRAAEDARASLAAIVASSQEAIIGMTLDGAITSWNPAAERLYGYPGEEAVGRNQSILLWPEQRREEEEILECVRAGGKVDAYETTRATKEGRSVDVSISLSPIRDWHDRLVGMASVHRDIRERKRSQAKMQSLQSQRLESLGHLAGGVAHDFNNLLAAILTYSELIAEEPADEHAVRQGIAEIKRAAERAAVLTHQLLIFGRREVVNPEVLDLNAVVGDMEKILRRTIGEHIDLRTKFEPNVWPTKADPSGVEQVLMNLVVNARDAIEISGMISIETANVEVTDETQGEQGPVPGRYVRLSVGDTGSGMAEDVSARAFEPFFTTKARGLGSGLGLATVYGIVTQSGGDVRLDSAQGFGTVVRVYLPATEEVPKRAEHRAADALEGHGEVILVVEDEDQVRDLTVRVLSRRGYEVLSAANGVEALETVARREGPLHLLLTDVVMPQMSGWELAQQVLAARPDALVLFMSGYPQDVLECSPGAGKPLLEKPFTIQALLGRVRRILDGEMPGQVNGADG